MTELTARDYAEREAELRGGELAGPNPYVQDILARNPQLADGWPEVHWIRVNGNLRAPTLVTTTDGLLEWVELLRIHVWPVMGGAGYWECEPWDRHRIRRCGWRETVRAAIDADVAAAKERRDE